MAERGEGVAAPDQRQRQKPTKSTTEPTTTIAKTKSRPSRTTTAFTFKLVRFQARIFREV